MNPNQSQKAVIENQLIMLKAAVYDLGVEVTVKNRQIELLNGDISKLTNVMGQLNQQAVAQPAEKEVDKNVDKAANTTPAVPTTTAQEADTKKVDPIPSPFNAPDAPQGGFIAAK